MSWTGLCPSARQSGPRTRPGKKGQGNTWLRGGLDQAAVGASAFLGERYSRIARRRGKAKPTRKEPAWLATRLLGTGSSGRTWHIVPTRIFCQANPIPRFVVAIAVTR